MDVVLFLIVAMAQEQEARSLDEANLPELRFAVEPEAACLRDDGGVWHDDAAPCFAAARMPGDPTGLITVDFGAQIAAPAQP